MRFPAKDTQPGGSIAIIICAAPMFRPSTQYRLSAEPTMYAPDTELPSPRTYALRTGWRITVFSFSGAVRAGSLM